MTGLQDSCKTLSTIVLGVGLFVESSVLTFCTAVLAIIGIVAGIVLYFIKKQPPPSPSDQFYTQQVVPFLSSGTIEMPDDWTPPTYS